MAVAVAVAVWSCLFATTGEWHYTTHLGDPEHGGPNATHWEHRAQVLAAILDMAGPSLTVEVRTLEAKRMALLGGVDTSALAPVDATQVSAGALSARVGYHNDCFLASDSDFGTYLDVDVEYPFLARDTAYVLWPRHGTVRRLTPGALQVYVHGRRDVQREPASQRVRHRAGGAGVVPLHVPEQGLQPRRARVMDCWRLHAASHCHSGVGAVVPDVIRAPAQSLTPFATCRAARYRLELVTTTAPRTVARGAAFNVTVSLRNVGWAAPVGHYRVDLVLRHTTSARVCVARVVNASPKFWLPANVSAPSEMPPLHSISGRFVAAAGVAPGNYSLLLAVSGDVGSLARRAEYVGLPTARLAWSPGVASFVVSRARVVAVGVSAL